MRLITIKEVSEFLSVKKSTLYSWVHNGSIPFHKLNGLVRFDMNELESWVKASRKAPSDAAVIAPKKAVSDVDRLVKKSIDSVKGYGYNHPTGNQANIRVSGRRTDGTV